ncbi:transporter substrate-binding domain-containing protein [Vibrio navarrensis]
MRFPLRKKVCSAILLCLSTLTHAETLTLTSLEWPPYSSASLPQYGASVAVVSAALNAVGHNLEVEFYPWERAVYLARHDTRYVGYFPEYFFDTDSLLFSNAIGFGPLGFVERKDAPIHWHQLQDLKPYVIGVVRGYVNTPALDSMIANGELKVSLVSNDLQNLGKVGLGRISLAVIDQHVFQYFLEHTPYLAPLKDKLQMNNKLLAEKSLYVAFNNDPTGERWKAILNDGLQKIDIDKVMAEYFATLKQKSAETEPQYFNHQ